MTATLFSSDFGPSILYAGNGLPPLFRGGDRFIDLGLFCYASDQVLASKETCQFVLAALP